MEFNSTLTSDDKCTRYLALLFINDFKFACANEVVVLSDSQTIKPCEQVVAFENNYVAPEVSFLCHHLTQGIINRKGGIT